MSNHIEPDPESVSKVDVALIGLHGDQLSAPGWAYLAAEAVRALNHSTAVPGGYRHPGDIHAVLGHLRCLADRVAQALSQADEALGEMHEIGKIHDITTPENTARSVAEVIEDLDRCAETATALRDTLTRPHRLSARLARTGWTFTPDTTAAGAGAR